MSLLQAENITKAYGAHDVLQGISLAVPHQARIALLGPNGIGKTTLLRILAGADEPDRGNVYQARNLRIGYLPQESLVSGQNHTGESTLWEFALKAYETLLLEEERLKDLESAMADPNRVDEAITRYGVLQEAFERKGGYTYQARIRSVLTGLGFNVRQFDQPLHEMSGGERTRADLARLLLEDPELLILDEPTNHLDVDAVEWLENWLRDWAGAVVLVSHDRYFLDQVIDVVWELSSNRLETFRGGYSEYVVQRVVRDEYQLRRYSEQQEFIRSELAYIQKNIAGQNTRQAQGRRKRLQRMMAEELVERPTANRTAKIDFGESTRSGDIVLRTKELVIGIPSEKEILFKAPDLELRRGARVALIGPNGAGKTTFLKMLLGELPPRSGSIQLGASLQIGYLDQAHAGLNPDQNLMDVIAQYVGPSTQAVRDYLARFAFIQDDVFKLVKDLSGGERSRLALAVLIIRGANFLLLDEPTNHLDIPSQEILEDALLSFGGTILLVSHDRYLIDSLAEQLWVISPDSHQLSIFPAGYDAYRMMVDAQEAEKKSGSDSREHHRPARIGRAGSTWELRSVEERIEALEAELASVSAELDGDGLDAEEAIRLGERYAEIENLLTASYSRWEALAQDTTSA